MIDGEINDKITSVAQGGGTSAPAAGADNSGDLVEAVSAVVGQLDMMEELVERYNPAKADNFHNMINDYVSLLKNVDSHKDQCGARVPIDALHQLDADEDNNPEQYSQKLLRRCKTDFEQLGHRLEGVDLIREELQLGWLSAKDTREANLGWADAPAVAAGGGGEGGGGRKMAV